MTPRRKFFNENLHFLFATFFRVFTFFFLIMKSKNQIIPIILTKNFNLRTVNLTSIQNPIKITSVQFPTKIFSSHYFKFHNSKNLIQIFDVLPVSIEKEN